MYIGSSDAEGLLNIFKGLIDSMVGEDCTQITVTLENDGAIALENDGPGISVEKCHSGQSLLEVLFTQLPCGSVDHSEKVIACALSEWLEVETSFKDEIGWINTYAMDFSRGKATSELEACEYFPETGLSITFIPDHELFGDTTIDPNAIQEYIEELRQGYPSLNLSLVIEN